MNPDDTGRDYQYGVFNSSIVRLNPMVFNKKLDYLSNIFRIIPDTKNGKLISNTNNLKLPSDIKTKLNYVRSNIKKCCFYKNSDPFVNLMYYYYDRIENNKPPYGDTDEIEYSLVLNITYDYIDKLDSDTDKEGFEGLNVPYLDHILKDLDYIEENYLK